MKTAGILLSLLPALFVSVARADYIVQYLFEAFDQANDLTIKLKDTKSRIDYADGSILADSETEYLTVLNHTSKTYTKLTGESLINSMRSMIVGGLGVSESADFKPTGRTEKINGYETQEFIASTAGLQMSLFLANDVSSEQKLSTAVKKIYDSPAFDSLRGIAALAQKRSGIPIRIVYELLGLKIIMTLQSVDEKTLDDREFAIPAGYREEG
jgi:hypothetical protein